MSIHGPISGTNYVQTKLLIPLLVLLSFYAGCASSGNTEAIETTVASRIYATQTASAKPVVIATTVPIQTATSSTKLSFSQFALEAGSLNSLPYDVLARDTESFVGKKVGYVGQVIQVIENGGLQATLLITVNDNKSSLASSILWLDYEGSRILEGDKIDFWGTVIGRQEYQSLSGQQRIVPRIRAAFIRLGSKVYESK